MNKVLATLSIGTLLVIAAPGVANAKGGGGVAHAKKTTAGPSGSFTVRKRIPDLAGTDMITAAAKNTATGETCSATISL